MQADWHAQLDVEGHVVLPGVLESCELTTLKEVCASLCDADGLSQSVRGRSSANRRNLLGNPAIASLAWHRALRALVEPVLGRGAFAVRGILFDKVPGSNWKVPWHQDLSIAVRLRKDVPGFGPWSVKDGVPHVQPPLDYLERMLTVRLHLDDCGAENGPLRVLPGTHRLSRLDALAIQHERRTRQERLCVAAAGGALLMRPLLLHASSPAEAASHRRVIHLEFAEAELPAGLEWWERVE